MEFKELVTNNNLFILLTLSIIELVKFFVRSSKKSQIEKSMHVLESKIDDLAIVALRLEESKNRTEPLLRDVSYILRETASDLKSVAELLKLTIDKHR